MARRIHQRSYVYEDMLEDIYAEEVNFIFERLTTHVFPQKLAECRRLKGKDDICVLEALISSRSIENRNGKYSFSLDDKIIAKAIVKKFADEGIDCTFRGLRSIACRIPRE